MGIKNLSERLSKYSAYYNPASLFAKIGKVAKKIGVKAVHTVLILYYATLDKRLPLKDRALVIAALGYFIVPIDLIPDALPGGFADDTAALVFILKHIWNNLSQETFDKAKRQLAEWFPDTPAPTLPDIKP